MATFGQCTQAMLAQLANNTYHPDVASPNRTPLPGLKSAAHNIYNSETAGKMWARKETVAGMACIHVHVGAGARRSGDGGARAELELNMPNIGTPSSGAGAKEPVYYGYTIWTAFNPSSSATLPQVNIHFQLKGNVGGPAVSIQSLDRENGRGIYLTENNSRERYNLGLAQSDLLVPHRIVMGFLKITKGDSSGSHVRCWMDGDLVVDDTNWLSNNGAGALGGLIFSDDGDSSAYNKFGIYGSGSYSSARDYYFTDIIAAPTLAEVGTKVDGGTTQLNPTPPTPGGLHVARVGDRTIEVDWNDVPLRVGDYYRVEVI